VNNMKDLFLECSSLKFIPDISKWNIENVNDISCLFYKCSSLISLPNISKWNINKVNNMIGLFYGCSSLKELPVFQNGIWKILNAYIICFMNVHH